MLDVLNVNKKESEVNAILRKLGTSAKSFFSKVVENNLNWRGNWPRDRKLGVLVCVGVEGKHSKFSEIFRNKTNTSTDCMVNTSTVQTKCLLKCGPTTINQNTTTTSA